MYTVLAIHTQPKIAWPNTLYNFGMRLWNSVVCLSYCLDSKQSLMILPSLSWDSRERLVSAKIAQTGTTSSKVRINQNEPIPFHLPETQKHLLFWQNHWSYTQVGQSEICILQRTECNETAKRASASPSWENETTVVKNHPERSHFPPHYSGITK